MDGRAWHHNDEICRIDLDGFDWALLKESSDDDLRCGAQCVVVNDTGVVVNVTGFFYLFLCFFGWWRMKLNGS